MLLQNPALDAFMILMGLMDLKFLSKNNQFSIDGSVVVIRHLAEEMTGMRSGYKCPQSRELLADFLNPSPPQHRHNQTLDFAVTHEIARQWRDGPLPHNDAYFEDIVDQQLDDLPLSLIEAAKS